MKKIVNFLVFVFTVLAVGYPVWVVAQETAWSSSTLVQDIFPFFGLIAVSLLWIHSLSGVFEDWLRKYINFNLFISITATIILICIILHPFLLFMALAFDLNKLIYGFTHSYFLLLGGIAWLLLITYDIGKFLKKTGYSFFAKHWNAILIISNIGFLLAFPHSLALGSDLQSGRLRAIWIFYGITALLSLVYTYAIKPMQIKK